MSMSPGVSKLINQYGITEGAREFLSSSIPMYIDGKFIKGDGAQSSVIVEPCTGGELATVSQASVQQVDLAVLAARKTLDGGEWSRLNPREREALIRRLADLMERDSQVLAEIESLNAGKAIGGCKNVDVMGSINLLRYMAGWSSKIEGATRNVSADGTHFAYTLKEPIGVVGAIVPWNWPLSMAVWKLAAPLAAGCSIVLKPSEITPLSILYVARLCDEAGFPDGVINIVTGPGSTVGKHLSSHPGINKLSFTGSTEVGKSVGTAAMENVTHVTLELGGKSPMIVCGDANIEAVVEATQRSVFFNAGQVCSAGSRMYVHRSIYQDVVDAVAARAGNMKLGFSLDVDVEMGPVISERQKTKIEQYIATGKQEGAKVACGGKPWKKEGFYVQPTVFHECHNRMAIVQEEIFGPVLAVVPFDDEDDVIALANDNIYGLAASIFTSDLSKALDAIPKIKAGTVWVNTHDYVDFCMPFGGYKQSGLGKDLGPEQLSHFLQTKAVWIKIN